MDKLPTIQDVAGALGMHKSTVSLALSGKGNVSTRTRERIVSVARELGYEPNPVAQRLATGLQNPSVCLFSGVLDTGLATEKILIIQKALSAHSYEVPIYTCPEPTGDAGSSQVAQIKQLCRQRPRAIICATQMVEPAVLREIEQYQNTGGIVVTYDIPVSLACDQVVFDREDNAYQAAQYLLKQGHRRIGIGMSNTSQWMTGEPDSPQWYRLKGFHRALEEYGVPVCEDWFFRNGTYEKGGAEMARRFLALRDRPTALSIVNDYVVLAFMVEIIRAGVRVPQDISLVGHDNQPIADYCPVPLTSVSQPTDKIAQAVVDLLLERLSGSQAPPQTVVIKGELVERQTVAATSMS